MALSLPPFLHHVASTLPSSLPPSTRSLMSRSRSSVPLSLLRRHAQLSRLHRGNHNEKETETKSSRWKRNVYSVDRGHRVTVGEFRLPETIDVWNAGVDGGSSESEKSFIELDSRKFFTFTLFLPFVSI